MRIPRHWARASASLGEHTTEAFGHSDVSLEDARRDARERATRVLRWLDALGDDAAPGPADEPGRYGYGGDRPMREPVLREFGAGADRFAALTRNHYGATVLNTRAAAFIDVDLAGTEGRAGGAIARAWARIRGRPVETAETKLARIREATDAERLGVRIYRTAAGFRCLVTSELLDPSSRRAHLLLERFGCDVRYATLCRVQRCFRARLTPKPWRAGCVAPAWPWPFRTPAHEAAFEAWLRTYEQASSAFGVCELLEERGPRQPHPVVAEIIRVHDAIACSAGRPLA